MLHNEGSLALTVVSANDMPDVERMGKQDPYTQLTLHLDNKESWQKTGVQKDAGKNAYWNQNFEFALTGEPELYVEVMDEEKGVDEVIGFCAIPINQVVQAPGGYFNGLFGLFLVNGKSAGSIHMILTARGFNSPPGGNQQQQQPVQGRSHISEEHLKRVKTMRHKAFAGDIGTAVLGGALAVGAGFLGNKFYKDHEKKEQEEQEQKEQEQEKLEREQAEAEAQRRRQEEEAKQRAEFERRHQQEQHEDEGEGEHHDHSCSGHHHHHEHHHSSGGGAGDWDPVGTYAAGDRVQYHGRDYICLQGHTSNPTWQPGAAVSLWQPA
ncbi:C2 domain-containing protein [Zychaea mexicana]|uniref:C2 domain-containing protein n=1 Tax=Zychaea mexicana TaxID=64656 RepID=UPI0022FEAC67|nr:C2 domain-containing protein [Zychaea mexicana]KAI9496767.1 C2 domain-containing protein [Zychaea mexicana]